MLYRILGVLLAPLARWGRVRVTGLELVPREGPVLIVPNHDSQMDPVLVGLALRRVRPVRFLARANLWGIPGLGAVMTALRQIPVERGAGDAAALQAAVDTLRAGEAVCIFPEGRLSRGERVRARSGVARLARACPEAGVVLCAIAGSTDYARFPRRPQAELTFLAPSGGGPLPGEEPRELAARLLDEVRALAPPIPAGRKPMCGVPSERTREA